MQQTGTKGIQKQAWREGNLLGITQKTLGGVMVIVVGIGHGDTSSNPGWDWMHFT